MTALRIKAYDPSAPPKKPRTEAQEVAARRTWRIIQLRSLWCLSCHVRTAWRLRVIRGLIDAELRDLGAEEHGVRFKRQRAEFEDRLRERLDPIPF